MNVSRESLTKRINDQLQRVTSLPGHRLVRVLDLPMEGGANLNLAVGEVDSLACGVKTICVTLPHLATAAPAELRQRAEALAQNIHYLSEPLAVMECDEEGARIQLRSNPPAADQRVRTYFELCVAKTGVTLERYQKTPQQPRCQMDAVLTRETLHRLAWDLCHV